MTDGQPTLRIVPVTTATANRYVKEVHRHHGPCPPALVAFSIGVCSGEDLRGVAIVGRPANRNSDDGQTAEVLRVATDGCPNACSALYGATVRVARQMGYARIITYTLATETGISLRAAGWVQERGGITSWWHRYPESNAEARRTVQTRAHYDVHKLRWGLRLREPHPWSWQEVVTDPEPTLFDNDFPEAS